jgi:hypothetical protein
MATATSRLRNEATLSSISALALVACPVSSKLRSLSLNGRELLLQFGEPGLACRRIRNKGDQAGDC